MEIIIAFHTSSAAIAAEALLLGAGLNVRVMSLPSSIRAGCGLCLRIAPADVGPALALMKAEHIAGYHLYRRLPQNGASTYQPYKEEEHA